MAFVPTVGTAKSVFEGTASGVPIINTLWFYTGGAWGAGALATLNAALENWWTNWFKLYTSDIYTLTSITSYDMSSETGPKNVLPIGEVGSLLGGVASFQSVLTIKFGTANRGRSGRGRNDISPIRETDLTDNVINTGHRTNWLTTYQNLNLEVQTLIPSCEHSVVSFHDAGVPRTAGLPQTVTSYESVQSYVRTRKSRREP